MSITATVTGAAEIRDGLQQRANDMMSGVRTAIKVETLNLLAYIVEQKLSDQVLKVRSGRLRRSLTPSFSDDGNTYSGQVGTNVVYARALEYGMQDTVQVPSYSRMQTMSFGRPMADPRMVQVRAHPMKMNIAPHPYMRPSLKENSGRITDNLRQALLEAIS